MLEYSRCNRNSTVGSCDLAAIVAYKLKMGVKAGHGLTYNNVFYILGVPHLEELNIGHSIVTRSGMVGMEQAVRDMKGIFCQ